MSHNYLSNGVKMAHLISHEWYLFPQNQFKCFKLECLVILIIKKNLEIIKHHENIKYTKSDFKYTSLKLLSVFDKGSWRESMTGY